MSQDAFGLPSSVSSSQRALIETMLNNVVGFSFAVCSMIGSTDNFVAPHFKLGLISEMQRRLQLPIELLEGELVPCDLWERLSGPFAGDNERWEETNLVGVTSVQGGTLAEQLENRFYVLVRASEILVFLLSWR